MRRILLFVSFLFLLAPRAGAEDVFQVRHVTDGDTLVLENGQEVRLIGVDTPEMNDESRNRQNARRNRLSERTVEEFASRAKAFARDQVEGQKVRLEYDWQARDKYGRALAYVYREPDGYFLNAELVKQGYGFAYFAFPFRHSRVFYEYSKEARAQKRGLWK